MTCFLIAGEASGDLHAAHLIEQLRLRDASLRFVGLGGDKMREAGCQLYVDYRNMAYMGVVEVFKHSYAIGLNMEMTRQSLLKERPEILILIDYPTFNMQVALFCRRHLPNTRIIYYIPPKIWAWKTWRVRLMARIIDQVLGIFPFEEAFYARYGVECTYVGNPTMDCILAYRQEHPVVQPSRTIALLPGSRKSEISHCLPTMLAAAARYRDYQVVVVAAPGVDDSFYTPLLAESSCPVSLTREPYDALSMATAAVVNSGTATLEAALIGCPQVAVYHVACGRLLGLLRPLMFHLPWFTLPNIIAGRMVIRELIAYLFTEDAVAEELGYLLHNQDYRSRMKRDYQEIAAILGTAPSAETAASLILNKASGTL